MRSFFWLDIAVKIAQVMHGVLTPAIAVVIGYFTWRMQHVQAMMSVIFPTSR